MTANSFAELILKYNPFGIKDENGECMIFENYGKMYVHVLETLQNLFPKGYIDLALFVLTLTQQPLGICKRFTGAKKFMRELERQSFLSEGVLMCEPVEGVFPKETVESLFRALHTLSDTTFAIGYFNVAWDEVFGYTDNTTA